MKMLNIASSLGQKDNLSECMIELARKDPCYYPGERLQGRLYIKLSQGSIDITALKITLLGTGKVNIKGKKEESLQKRLIYVKKEWTIINSLTSIYDKETSYQFEETLPEFLPSSLYSSKGHIQYSIIAVLEYNNNDGEHSMVKAVRGITVIEELDLNKLSRLNFEPISEFEHRKFGWFLCTGGYIKLSLLVDRSAYVCGEGVSIIGRIENKSDRHIEKVSAVLQRRIRFGNDIDEVTETCLVDIQDMQEDILAMYVVEGSSTKIDKNIHIPPVVPSTPSSRSFHKEMNKDEGGRFHIRRKSHSGPRLSISTQRSRLSVPSVPSIQRLMHISYNYLIRVRSAGVDAIAINIPVIIGSRPLMETVTRQTESRGGQNFAVYKLCKHDRAIPLLDEKERTLCNKAQLQHMNKYPFYPDLTTSAKQSKKICVITNTVRTEKKVLNNLRNSAHDEKTAESKTLMTEDYSNLMTSESGNPLYEKASYSGPEEEEELSIPKSLDVEDLSKL